MIPRLDAPIVLVHGLFGFDKIQVGSLTLANYFPGIVEALQNAGNRVFVPSLSPTAGIAERGKQLKDFVRKTCPYDKIHIIAHSMGGLDARFMITHLDMANQVASLTTLGTPHRGSSFADWAIAKVEWLVRPALAVLNMPHQAFYDLTAARCRDFNTATPNVPGVRYFSVAAEHDAKSVNPEWRLSHSIVHSLEGPNDGVVSLASAHFGEACDVWPGDHLSLVNCNPLRAKPADTLERWQKVIERLADCKKVTGDN